MTVWEAEESTPAIGVSRAEDAVRIEFGRPDVLNALTPPWRAPFST
jgi:hypothetical protein